MSKRQFVAYHQATILKVIILFTLTGFLLTLSYITLAQSSTTKPETKKVSMLIPVRTRHAIIQYELPDNYKLAYNGSRNQRLFLEFIPKDQELTNWNTIATLIQFPMPPKKELRARDTIEQLIKGLEQHPQVKFLDKPRILATQSYGIDIQYTTINYYNASKKRNEILRVKSLQGDLDIWMFQATSHYQGEDKTQAIKNCEEVMNSVTIMKRSKLKKK